MNDIVVFCILADCVGNCFPDAGVEQGLVGL
jgi:hypothetical protein